MDREKVALSPGHSQIYLAAVEDFESSLGTGSRSLSQIQLTQNMAWKQHGNVRPLEGNHRSALETYGRCMERRFSATNLTFLPMFQSIISAKLTVSVNTSAKRFFDFKLVPDNLPFMEVCTFCI